MSSRKHYYTVKENIVLLSILFSILFSCFFGRYEFAITWIISVLLLGNARRFTCRNPLFYFLRLSSYFLHFGIFIFIVSIDAPYFTWKNYYWIIIMFAIVVCYYLMYRNTFILRLSKYSIANISTKYTKSQYVMLIYNSIGAAICEELYFRFILINLFKNIGVFSIIISSIYFVLFHYTLLWSGNFKHRDFITQFIFGVIFGAIYFYSENIIYSIIIHIFINLPRACVYLRLYHRYYINPSYYNICKNKDDFDELLI